MRYLGQEARSRSGVSGLMESVKDLLKEPGMLSTLATAAGALQGELNPEKLRAFAMKCVLDFLGQEQRIQKEGVLAHYLPEVVGALEAMGRNTPEGRTLLRTEVAGLGLQKLDADSTLLVMTMEHHQQCARDGKYGGQAPPMTGARAEAFAALWEQASPETRKAILDQQALWPKVAEFWKNALNGQYAGGEPPIDPWGVGKIARGQLLEQVKGDLNIARSMFEQIQRVPSQFDVLQPQLQGLHKKLQPSLELLGPEQSNKLLKEALGGRSVPVMSDLLLKMKERQLSELAAHGRNDVRDPQFESDDRYKPFTLLKPAVLNGRLEQQINQLQNDWAKTIDQSRQDKLTDSNLVVQGGTLEKNKAQTAQQAVSVSGYLNADPKLAHTVQLQGEISLPLAPEQMKVTAPFGQFRETRYHKGTDYGAPWGSTVLTAHEGTVVDKGFDKNGWGNYIVIKRQDGLCTLYGHLAEPSALNKEDAVTSGESLGKVGATGNARGAHLHFEAFLEQDGKRMYLDPATLYTLQRGVTGDRVKQLQTTLKQQGYNLGDADGHFGLKTEAALEAFQKAHGIPETRKVDTNTARLLTEQANAPAPSTQPVLTEGRLELGKWPGNLDPSMIPQIQQVLGIPQTGVYDEATKQAVRSLQSANRLADDGKVGEKTWELFRAISHVHGKIAMVEGYNMSMLISDQEFRNKDALTLDQIRGLLKGSSLDNQTLPVWRMTSVNTQVPGAYVPATHPKYWCYPTSDTCDPALAIYQAAQKYGINPLVLLTQLQKEASLLDKGPANPDSLALGMGYDVPDTGGIGTNTTGIDRQIDAAAHKLAQGFDGVSGTFPRVRYNINDIQQDDRVITVAGHQETIPWAVEVQNKATWLLYSYTPHVIDWNEWKKHKFGGGNLNFAREYNYLKAKVQGNS